MITRIKTVATILAVVLFDVAVGQVKSDEPVKTIPISGRIVDSAGAPIPGQTVNFRNLTILRHRVEDSPVKTDQKGMFTFSAARHVLYETNLIASEAPPVFKGIGTIEVVDGQAVEMGNIVLQFTAKHEPMVHVLGPIQMIGLPSSTNSTTMAPSLNTAGTIAAVYTLCSDVSPEFCDHPALHIVQGDGREIEPPKEKEQVGCSSPRISEDKSAAGWLVDHDNCCTSYPLQLMLVVYRPGKPLRHFTGDGRAIFGWNFVGRGKQVAFFQSFPHGDPVAHYELRDVATERLIGKWDDDETRKAPSWTQGLEK